VAQRSTAVVTGKREELAYNIPFKAFRFLVEVDGASEISGAFAACSGFRMKTQMVQARSGADFRGVKDNYPGITEYDTVTLSKGVLGDSKFLDWVLMTNFPGTDSSPNGVKAYQDLRLIALNEQGQPGVVWTLRGATPVSYALKDLDAGQNAVMMESVEFAFTGVFRAVVGEDRKDSVYRITDIKPKIETEYHTNKNRKDYKPPVQESSETEKKTYNLPTMVKMAYQILRARGLSPQLARIQLKRMYPIKDSDIPEDWN